MTDDIRSVQIIRIEETEFVFDYDAVKKIIDSNPECADLPVAIVIINGALRTGKSFFINFVIRHLLEAEGIEQNNSMLKDYFRSRRGPDIQTLGIWALNKIFILNGKAIILMDTQGIFDRQLNQAMTTALICLSTLMSSYQIYNLDKRIQEDHLNNMAYFSAYTDLMTELSKDTSEQSKQTKLTNQSEKVESEIKVGQTLSLLVRDWQNFEDVFDLKNCKNETERYQQDFLFSKAKDDVKRATRKRIMNTFDRVNVRLCPHPGHMVTEGVFTGKLDQIRKEFTIHMDYIINDILENLEAKRISSNIDLICSDVPDFMRRYVELYRNIKDTLPEPRTILETTSKISQTGAKTNTVTRYKQIMMDRIRTNGLTREEIEVLHISAKNQSYKYFNEMCVMGDDTEILTIMKSIDADIDIEYSNFLLMAVERNIMSRILEFFSSFMSDLSMILNMNFKELGLKAIIPALMVIRYLLGFIIPAGLFAVIDWFLSIFFWMLVGMFILQITQSIHEKNDLLESIDMSTKLDKSTKNDIEHLDINRNSRKPRSKKY